MTHWIRRCPGDTGRVRDGHLGLMNPELVLISGNHGGKCEQILWGKLLGVLGFHPGGGGTFPPNLKYCGGCGCLTLSWDSVIEIAALKKFVVAKHKCKRPKKIFRLD